MTCSASSKKMFAVHRCFEHRRGASCRSRLLRTARSTNMGRTAVNYGPLTRMVRRRGRRLGLWGRGSGSCANARHGSERRRTRGCPVEDSKSRVRALMPDEGIHDLSLAHALRGSSTSSMWAARQKLGGCAATATNSASDLPRRSRPSTENAEPATRRSENCRRRCASLRDWTSCSASTVAPSRPRREDAMLGSTASRDSMAG